MAPVLALLRQREIAVIGCLDDFFLRASLTDIQCGDHHVHSIGVWLVVEPQEISDCNQVSGISWADSCLGTGQVVPHTGHTLETLPCSSVSVHHCIFASRFWVAWCPPFEAVLYVQCHTRVHVLSMWDKSAGSLDNLVSVGHLARVSSLSWLWSPKRFLLRPWTVATMKARVSGCGGVLGQRLS